MLDSDSATPPIFTPASSSAFTFSFSLRHGSQSPFQLQGSDTPIPSVESGVSTSVSSSSRSQNLTPTSSPRPSSTRSPAPLIAISPSPDGPAATPSQSSLGVGELNARIQDIQLSQRAEPLDMSGLAAALPPTPIPNPSQSPSTASTQGEPSRPPAGRNRRSSSRVNLLPHNVRDEELPHDRFHEPAFQQAFCDAKALMGGLAGVLASSTLHVEPDSTIHNLRQEAQTLATFHCSPTRVVGLVGDSGVGKSSLLNSLLDVHGLARVSNIGAACTCVVTEYRFHEANNFAIKVDEFNQEELRRQFVEMVSNYRHHHFHSPEIDNDGDRRHWEDLAKLARDTFSVMFRGRFTPSSLTSGQENEVVETLLSWAEERNRIPGDIIANTAEECSAKLMNLTSEEASPREPAAWPYIKKISVSLNSHILSKGLVLVDLPGLRDLNSARRTITERYLLNCDEIFAVCSIGRATTDEGVMSVFGLARQARLSNVGIICTRSDDIRAEEAKKDWRGERATKIQELMDCVSAAERGLVEMRERVSELEGFGDDLLDGEEDEKIRLYRDIERQRIVVEDRELALQRYLILKRNALVSSKLIEQYKTQIPGGNVSVFCASNILYWDNRNKTPSQRAMPFLTLSGILDIRKHCISLVSESQMRLALQYMQDKIPNLVSRIDLWVQSGAGTASAEQKQAVRTSLDQLEASLRQIPLPNVPTPGSVPNTGRNINHWTQGAIKAGDRWSGWHHMTYSAFCRAYGIHTTAKAGYHNWNEEAIETMAQELSDPWSTFEEVLSDTFEVATTFINEGLDSAAGHLGDMPEGYESSVLPLYYSLTSLQRLVATEVEGLCDAFEDRAEYVNSFTADWPMVNNPSDLRTNALSGLRTAFFAQGMEETYADANRMSGTGSDARRKRIINGRLAEQEQFRTLMRRFKTEFGDLATQLQTEIQGKLKERLDVIAGILDIIRSDNVAEESERDPEFRERVNGEIQRVKEAMGEVLAVARDGE
ncbi:hypothetical protein OQA88_20 [Cercophora sp. LCS_1]